MNKKQKAKSEHKAQSWPEIPSHPDFVKMEEELLASWYREGVVDAYLHRNDTSRDKFSFLDGPITANNPMGVHHGRGRTYKDLWQRYQNMLGKRQRFQNGFDCQGLWVEVEVEKELGFRSKKDIHSYGVEKFVNKCKERVLKFSAIQTEQSQRLGMFMDWPHSYFTMSAENNYAIWNFLKVCHQRGWIYKGNDSVPWCPRCETAISQHEMLTEDYKLVTHRAIYLELPIIGRKREFLLVWTTTPWTIPANIAVAVDENLDYSLVEGLSGDLFWVAKDRVEAVFNLGGDRKVAKTVKGKELVGLHYRGPFDDLPAVRAVAKESPDKFHLVIATDPQILPVTTSEGTGLVHTAVSAGSEDFKLGQKLELPMVPVIADNADYVEGLGFLTGNNAKKHPEIILDYLELRETENNENWVFSIEDYSHRYPACWRCKTELVWKVTDEWYISMDKNPSRTQNSKLKTSGTAGSRFAEQNQRTLREQIKEVAKDINWIPEFGLERELDWLTNMHDWLISKKNRFWGLALPIYECANCGSFDVIGSEDELKKRAVSGWVKFEGHTPHKPWIDEVKIQCERCGQLVSRIEPVGNPWLDAGIVPFSTLPPDWFPADFITESFPGQFKNWFYSLLVMSTVLRGVPPFKTVLGFDSVTGEDGRPMHKSWGNMVEFNEGAGEIGVDVMRWMYAKTAPTIVLPFGYKAADEIRRRFMLILWNSFRFFMSQARSDGWKEKGSRKKEKGISLNILDKWIRLRLWQTAIVVTKSLDNYQSAPATEALEKFVTDFSTWYIRRSRDRVGPAATDDDDKHAAYQTMFIVLEVLSRLIAPIVPYLSDYIYQALTGEKSVHLADWPVSAKLRLSLEIHKPDQDLADKMQFVREIVQLGHSQRQTANINLRQPLSAVKISAESTELGEELTRLVKDELNVKQVIFSPRSSADPLVSIDTNLTDDLLAQGKARQIIRMIQQKRREAGVDICDKIIVFIPQWPTNYAETIKAETLALSLKKHPELKIKRVDS